MTKEKKEKLLITSMTVGLLLIVVGTCLPILQIDAPYFSGQIYKYVFAVGAGVLVISRLFTKYEGDNDRVRRLYRIESWSAIFFCVAAFFMFYDNAARDWLAFTIAGGAIQIYTSIMIPIASKRSNSKE